MSRHDAVNVLGKLLRDRELRRRFAADRDQVTRELGVCPTDRPFVLALEPDALEAQAESLIRKRSSEVSRLLPGTWKLLGDDAPTLFADYVDQSVWPEGHRRHLIDAMHFCHFLSKDFASSILSSERHWVDFLASSRSLSVRFVSGLLANQNRDLAIQFCCRRGGVALRKNVRVWRSGRNLSSRQGN